MTNQLTNHCLPAIKIPVRKLTFGFAKDNKLRVIEDVVLYRLRKPTASSLLLTGVIDKFLHVTVDNSLLIGIIRALTGQLHPYMIFRGALSRLLLLQLYLYIFVLNS